MPALTFSALTSGPNQASLTVPERMDLVGDDSGTDSDLSSDEDYDTADESLDSDEEEQEQMTEEQRKAERDARAIERQRVLQAAGLIIKSNTDNRRKPPARPIRARSFRKRRAPPAIPQSASLTRKELPAIPEPEPEPETSFRLDDAYERYEAYKKSNANMNRLSTVSVDTEGSSLNSPQPQPLTPTTQYSPSLSPSSLHTESDSLTHSLLHFFGKSKTPANEGETKSRPVISAPIMIRDPNSDNGRPQSQSGEQDADFGSVSVPFIIYVHVLTEDYCLVLGKSGGQVSVGRDPSQ